MLTVRADPSARTLAIDPATMTIRSVVTTIDPDRAGDVVVPTGLRNVEEFLMNPVGFKAIIDNSKSRCRAMTPVTVNGRLVYAVCVETGRGLRLRVEADEGERLGLFEGHMAVVSVRGRPAVYHVLSVVAVDPCWAWVELAAAPAPVAGR